MSEKKLVYGIATRRKSGKREREILLQESPRGWRLPGILISEGKETEELKEYMERILGRRVEVQSHYARFIDHRSGEKPIESYFVTVYSNGKPMKDLKEGLKWFGEEHAQQRDIYPLKRFIPEIIESLKRNNYL